MFRHKGFLCSFFLCEGWQPACVLRCISCHSGFTRRLSSGNLKYFWGFVLGRWRFCFCRYCIPRLVVCTKSISLSKDLKYEYSMLDLALQLIAGFVLRYTMYIQQGRKRQNVKRQVLLRCSIFLYRVFHYSIFVYCQPAAVRLDVGSVTTHSLLVGNISGCDFFHKCAPKRNLYTMKMMT